MLEKEQQIKQVKSKSYTVIRLINYKQYQEKEQQRDNSRTTAEQQQDTNNKDNKGNKENNIYSFDQFWNDYDKKVGKAKSQKLFSKLKDSDLRMIKEHVPKFVASVQDKQYLKHPTTYLNEKVWLDEELPTNGQHQLRVPNQDFV